MQTHLVTKIMHQNLAVVLLPKWVYSICPWRSDDDPVLWSDLRDLSVRISSIPSPHCRIGDGIRCFTTETWCEKSFRFTFGEVEIKTNEYAKGYSKACDEKALFMRKVTCLHVCQYSRDYCLQENKYCWCTGSHVNTSNQTVNCKNLTYPYVI